MQTSVLEVIDQSRKVVMSKGCSAKLLDCTNDLMIELDKSRTSERFACDRVQKKEARVRALDEHIEASDSKYLKTVEEAAQVEVELRTRVISLVSELKTKKSDLARFAEDRTDKYTLN